MARTSLRGHPVTISGPGLVLDCGAAAVSVAIPNRRDGTRSKWIFVDPIDNDHALRFIAAGGPDVQTLTGIRFNSGGGPIVLNVSGFQFISHRSKSGAATTGTVRIFALEDH